METYLDVSDLIAFDEALTKLADADIQLADHLTGLVLCMRIGPKRPVGSIQKVFAVGILQSSLSSTNK